MHNCTAPPPSLTAKSVQTASEPFRRALKDLLPLPIPNTAARASGTHPSDAVVRSLVSFRGSLPGTRACSSSLVPTESDSPATNSSGRTSPCAKPSATSVTSRFPFASQPSSQALSPRL